MAYLKPQSPIRHGDDYIYPLTTADQIVIDGGKRLSGVGVYLEKPDEFEDTTLEPGINAGMLGGYTFDAFKTYMLDLAHPIGSYYWSSEATNPSDLFGGTWEQIKDRFVLAAGDSYGVGATGGLSTTRHVSYLPPINSHASQESGTNYYNAFYERAHAYLSGNGGLLDYGMSAVVQDVGGNIGTNGSNATEVRQLNYVTNNMPPYLVAYCWRRTA